MSEHLRVERDYYEGLVERQQAEIERLRRNLTLGTPEYEALMERLAPIAGRAAAREFLAALREWGQR